MGKGGEGHEMGGSGGEREAWEWRGKMEGEMWGEWGESEVKWGTKGGKWRGNGRESTGEDGGEH